MMNGKRYFLASVATVAALVLAVFSAGQGKRTFAGRITDDECPTANHEAMQMGPTDAECTLACVEVHGASLVLYDGEHAYRLSDQEKPKQFAGQKVTITGTLDSKTSTIQLESITAAK
jgi:hypothetical protein